MILLLLRQWLPLLLEVFSSSLGEEELKTEDTRRLCIVGVGVILAAASIVVSMFSMFGQTHKDYKNK